MSKSKLEEALAFQLETENIPFEREYRFCQRRWRYDFYIKPKLLIEVQGGVWINGGHNRGSGYEKDCEKMARALEKGYIVLYCVAKDIKNGSTIKTIKKLFSMYRKDRHLKRKMPDESYTND